MKNPLLSLSALLLGLSVLAGCSNANDGSYTEQTAEIDPALQLAEHQAEARANAAELADTNDSSETEQTATEEQASPPMPDAQPLQPFDPANDFDAPSVELTDAQWRDILSADEFYVLRQSGTERPGTGRYLENDADEAGAYHCVGCGNYLYNASHKFHSGCGWPSFFQEIAPGSITRYEDRSLGMVRVEMRCARCDGHLGHIFNDGFGTPTGMRHCVNGTSLIFVPEGADLEEVFREHRRRYSER